MMMKEPAIETAAQAAEAFWRELPNKQNEERVWVMPLKHDGSMLRKPILVSVGCEDGTTSLNIREIFTEALKVGAESIIVAHNHPSGNLMPSKADMEATEKLKAAADLLEVRLVDHLIIGQDEYFSLVENGLC